MGDWEQDLVPVDQTEDRIAFFGHYRVKEICKAETSFPSFDSHHVTMSWVCTRAVPVVAVVVWNGKGRWSGRHKGKGEGGTMERRRTACQRDTAEDRAVHGWKIATLLFLCGFVVFCLGLFVFV